MLGFDIAKPQMLLPLPEQRTLGLEAIEELVNTIHSLGNGNKKEDLDPGVLRSIYGISGLIDKRVTSLTWSTKKGGTTESIQGKITKKVRERVAAHLSQPRFKLMLVDGVLDMADFNRRDRKCRIDPAIGTSVICSFGVDLEGIVQSLLRSPVRVKGLAKIQPDSDRVESLEMKAIEPLSSLDLGEGNFFASHTIKELVETQGVKPFAKASATAWLLSDEEVADFVSEIYGARERL